MKVLGKGSYGVVELARIKDTPSVPEEIVGKMIAVKKINKQSIRN